MDNNDLFLHFTKLINEMKGEVAELRASVIVLKLYIAMQFGQDKIIEVFQHLQEIEKMALRVTDPDVDLRKHLLDVVEALQQWKHRGTSGLDT